jgi:hypothetical protein
LIKRKCANILPKNDCRIPPNIVICCYDKNNEEDCGGFEENEEITLFSFIDKDKGSIIKGEI